MLLRLLQVFTLLCIGLVAPVLAQTAPLTPQQAWDAAYELRTEGPADVPLGSQAKLHLPEGFLFLPQAQSRVLMESMGNRVSSGFMGLVASEQPDTQWLITLDFTAEGFVRDEEARNWDKAALLQSLKDGTEAQNPRRKEMGFPGLHVVGWIEEPRYDAETHRLIWSMAAREDGSPAGTPDIVNYNTYALGRDGFFELDLLTSEAEVATDKLGAATVLASFEYNHGRRYQDYVAGTDKLATYGIAALIGGVAAKKLGLIAVIGLFLAKFAKLGIIIAIGFGAGIMRFFKGKGGDSA